ncbi:hypothetical protein M2272_002862 [Mycobacterium frederiksbergense]|uniref:Uncharacterized protein n=1 Tax=Mycolicibacterium frederiksbergense TaxID=117567 RepID=A0ABT6KZW4_9MYCO|nr:hypothetical protein [Mycolicibacterium frederiksbergense]
MNEPTPDPSRTIGHTGEKALGGEVASRRSVIGEVICCAVMAVPPAGGRMFGLLHVCVVLK